MSETPARSTRATPSPDRRAFLRQLALVGTGGAALTLSGCDLSDAGEPARRASPSPISRPLLLPWGEDVVRISADSVELPVAYVSMELRQVFVDRAFRDRATWLLNAHISVSTAHWRIPLPGDPVGLPISPGDALREFEELSIRAWDPTRPPSPDDIRIRRGRRVRRDVEFRCVAPSGTGVEEWYSAGPWDIEVCAGEVSETTREDFMTVGTGVRHRTRSCEGEGDAVRFITWACRPVST
jgi:hypothetical protein